MEALQNVFSPVIPSKLYRGAAQTFCLIVSTTTCPMVGKHFKITQCLHSRTAVRMLHGKTCYNCDLKW